jgi:phage-related protein
MAETFTYRRKAGASGTIEFTILKARFGDGYSQVAQDGIKMQRWPLSFDGGIDMIQPIIDFLDRHAGWKSFYWTPPGTSFPILFRAEKYNLVSSGGGVYSLSVEFVQVFM